MTLHFAAPCARGLEQALAEELEGLGLPDARPGHRVVQFRGDLDAGYRACLESRIASRVLLQIHRGSARDARDLYRTARQVRWLDHLDPDTAFAVSFSGTSRTLRNSHFSALKVKDAIVDQVRDDTGRRPPIDVRDPDVGVNAHLAGPDLTLSIDLSGPPLHRRGYDRDGGAAPARETLAAGILRTAGWPAHAAAGQPLVDPMCGSGTFLIEAADVLLDRAPGLHRRQWGFDRWLGHRPEVWEPLLAAARARVREPGEVVLFGFDRDPEQVERARDNLARAGLSDAVRVERGELAELEPPHPGGDTVPRGLVVTNPPHGERLGDPDEVDATWSLLGDVLRRRFLGWSAWLLAGTPALAKRLGLRPNRRHVVFNGAIEGRLLDVPIADRPVARDL